MGAKTEGGVLDGFPFSGLELLPKVRQTARNRFGQVTFQMSGFIKRVVLRGGSAL